MNGRDVQSLRLKMGLSRNQFAYSDRGHRKDGFPLGRGRKKAESYGPQAPRDAL